MPVHRGSSLGDSDGLGVGGPSSAQVPVGGNRWRCAVRETRAGGAERCKAKGAEACSPRQGVPGAILHQSEETALGPLWRGRRQSPASSSSGSPRRGTGAAVACGDAWRPAGTVSCAGVLCGTEPLLVYQARGRSSVGVGRKQAAEVGKATWHRAWHRWCGGAKGSRRACHAPALAGAYFLPALG